MALSGIIPGEGSLVKDSDELPLSEPRSVRYILPGEGLLVADSDDDLPPSGLPGGSVRSPAEVERPDQQRRMMH